MKIIGKPVTRIAIWLVLLWLFVESTSAIGSWVWKVLLQWEFLSDPAYTNHLRMLNISLSVISITFLLVAAVWLSRINRRVKLDREHAIKIVDEMAGEHKYLADEHKRILDAYKEFNEFYEERERSRAPKE